MSTKSQRLLTCAYYAALVAWALVSYVLLAQLHQERPALAIDFIQFYKDGCMLRLDPEHLADNPSHRAWLHKLIAPMVVDRDVPETGVLTRSIFMLPFSLLSLPAAFVVWYLLSIAFGVAAILFLRRGDPPLQKAGFCILAFASFPSYHTFWLGQFTWFLFASLAALYSALAARKRVPAGIAMAFSLIKLQYLPFLLPAFCRRPWWPVLAALAVCGSIVFVSLGLYTHWQPILEYAGFALQYDPAASTMSSLRGPLTLFFGYHLTLKLLGLCTLCGAGASVYAWRRYGDRAELLPWLYSILILASLLIIAHIFPYDSLLLLLLGLLTLPGAHLFGSRTGAHGLATPAYKAWSWIILTFPLSSWLAFAISMYTAELRVYAYFACALNIALLVLAVRCFAWLDKNVQPGLEPQTSSD